MDTWEYNDTRRNILLMETKARQIQRHLDSIRSNHNQTMSKRKYNENYEEDDEIDFDADKAVRKAKRQNSKSLLKKWQDAAEDDEYDDEFYAR